MDSLYDLIHQTKNSMNLDCTERGNHAFRNEEGAAVLFVKINSDGAYLQTAFTPMNYPSWNVSTIKLTDDELINHITYNLDGWHIDKCNFENVGSRNGYVIGIHTITEDVVEHVEKMADKYAFDPNNDDDSLDSAIRDSAKQLKYYLTEKMVKSCIEHYHEEH